MEINKIIKTVSGDTIVAQILSETISYVEVKNPFKIYSTFDNQNMKLEVIRWDWASRFDQPFRIYKTAIVSVSDPTFNLAKSYVEVVDNELHFYEKKKAEEAIDEFEDFDKKDIH